MNTEPLNDLAIADRIDDIRKITLKQTRRRRTIGRTALGVGIVGALGLGGVSAATAFFPAAPVEMQGIVKTKHLDEFLTCLNDAGVESDQLDDAAADAVLENWPDIDTDDYSVVVSRMAPDQQAAQGRLITACQTSIAEEVGESIY